MTKRCYTLVDLFCGAGGLSRGFEDAGFEIKLALDKEEKFKDTFNKNHEKPVFKTMDLYEFISESTKNLKVDLVIGSPPCQGFSDARGCRKEKNEKHKKRNYLPFSFIEIVEALNPNIAIMENVSGMGTFKINDIKLVDILVDKFDEIGYYAIFEKLNSANFGVPQERIRVFGLAIRKEFRLNPVLNKHDLKGNFDTREKFNKVADAFDDLPLNPSENGEVDYRKNIDECNEYQKQMRSKNSTNKIYNHKVINRPNEDELTLIKKLEEGKIYRSSRFGDRYMGVWQLYSDVLKEDECQLLHFHCRKRTNNDYKEEKGSQNEGYIRIEKFPTDKDGRFYWEEQYPINGKNKNRTPKEIIMSLLNKKWLRVKTYTNNGNQFKAYDINTKSGIRPMYMRLSRFQPSRTIMTTSFRVRELVHPTKHRAITLREGARIQSFPDDFIFYGNDKDIATMIGNAVPPLMAQEIAKYVKILLEFINGNADSDQKSIIKDVLKTKKPINTTQALKVPQIKKKTLYSYL
ncbi:MAG: DNA cytosine methyltransferase [Candidatus Helarchaeota archaeon]